MKFITILLLILVQDAVCAQQYIEPMKLEVSTGKTTNLVFPSAIVSIDRGSENIVVQKSTANVLRVKAQNAFTDETNLTVITAEGKVYSFLISYSPAPSHLIINLSNPVSVLIDTTLAGYCKRAINAPGNLYGLQYTKGEVTLAVTGFYVAGEIILCKLKMVNRSGINYGIDQFRFYIRDRKQAKRTSSQEAAVMPLYISGDTSSVAAKSAQTFVVALRKFSLADEKYLSIELTEKNGGRGLIIRCGSRLMLKAKTIL